MRTFPHPFTLHPLRAGTARSPFRQIKALPIFYRLAIISLIITLVGSESGHL
jgi:hypothetical protein